MDREIDPRDDPPVLSRVPEPVRDRVEPAERLPDSRDRAAVPVRGGRVRISPAERRTLQEIGAFRTVAIEDLASHRYRGDLAQMRQDLRSLTSQGLVQRRAAWLADKSKLPVVVLTRAGKDLMEKARSEEAVTGNRQLLYAGFVKPREVAHDAAIYRMFHAESSRIEQTGGRIRRVVLDYELKKKIYSPLARAKALPPLEYARRQAEIAQANALKVIDGRIPLPDLRIEYETSAGDLAKVDLELATHHYHGSHLAPKAQAGFKLYAADGSASRLSAALEEREITASILSL
jgi:hypothetical protein